MSELLLVSIDPPFVEAIPLTATSLANWHLIGVIGAPGWLMVSEILLREFNAP